MIVGIDEVGRGPWAGPLVVGAVMFRTATIEGLTDSKKLTPLKRQQLDQQLRASDAFIGLGWVSASEIDTLGLSEALCLATCRATEALPQEFDEIIIDGTVNFLRNTPLSSHVRTLKKADLLIPEVSAASIVAKVARDAFMSEQAHLYPEYSFDRNVGYGTALHQQALHAHGITPLHRLSFAPMKHLF